MSNDLHDAIMRLKQTPYPGFTDAQLQAYKYGHKDARHAAAELALGYVAASASCAAVSGELPPLIVAARNVVTQFNDHHVSLASVARYVNELESAIVQAPKAALTDAQIRDIWCSLGGQDRWLKDFGFIQFARAIEAASGPSPKLVEALRNFTDGCSVSVDAFAVARAALADAGVKKEG